MIQEISDQPTFQRFLTLVAVAAAAVLVVSAVVRMARDDVPGDFEVRPGDILLQDRQFEKAIERFDQAPVVQPDHRGALGGKAVALIGLERYAEAETVLIYLIDTLARTLAPDDPTGTGALAAAYANRGIIKDRQLRYEEALRDYVASIMIDHDIAKEPEWFERLLDRESKPSSALARAHYLAEQMKLPDGVA